MGRLQQTSAGFVAVYKAEDVARWEADVVKFLRTFHSHEHHCQAENDMFTFDCTCPYKEAQRLLALLERGAP